MVSRAEQPVGSGGLPPGLPPLLLGPSYLDVGGVRFVTWELSPSLGKNVLSTQFGGEPVRDTGDRGGGGPCHTVLTAGGGDRLVTGDRAPWDGLLDAEVQGLWARVGEPHREARPCEMLSSSGSSEDGALKPSCHLIQNVPPPVWFADREAV